MVIAQDPFSLLLWNIGHAFCHQLPDRSLFYGGFQMPVCARDTGTYLGFLVVFIFWLGLRRYRNGPKPDVIVLASAAIAMLPFIIDGIASYAGFYSTNNSIRLFSGLLMGAAMGLVLLSVYPLVAQKPMKSGQAFNRKDLIPILAIVMIVGIVLISFDLGAAMFFLLETLSIAGIIVLLFMAILTSLNFVLRKYHVFRSSTVFLLLACALEAGIIILLWFLHDLTISIIG